MNARTALLPAVALVLACAGNDPVAEDPEGVCGGGDPLSGSVFEGTAKLTTGLGAVPVSTCAVQGSGCKDDGAGPCVHLVFSGDNGTFTLIAGAVLPRASGTFECTSEQVAVSLSKHDGNGDVVFGGVASRDGDEQIGSCTVSNQSLDAHRWVGTIEATLEDRFHGATTSLSISGSMAAK